MQGIEDAKVGTSEAGLACPFAGPGIFRLEMELF